MFCQLVNVSTVFALRQENVYLHCLLLSGNAGATARNARIALLKVQIALDVMRSLSIQALVH